MIFFKYKTFFLTLAGFIWGLSGFTIELIPDDATQQALFLRLIVVLSSSFLIYLTIPINISKEYLTTIILLLAYLIVYIVSILIHEASFNHLLRESLLLYTGFTIIVTLYDRINLESFLKGIFYSLMTLVIYYFINVDFSQLLSPFYRFSTNLNPNGIGMMAVMFFVITTYSLYTTTKNKSKIILLLIDLIAITVILATRSRTSIFMMTIGFLMLNFLFKNKKTIIVTIGIGLVIILLNLTAFDMIMRVDTPDSYSGRHGIADFSGRTEQWIQGIEIINNNFWLGVGPDKATVRVGNHMGHFHNAYIQLMVTVGFFGFIPLLFLIISATFRTIFIKDEIAMKIIFLTGLVSSLVENRLLNFGSPGNLLFFISFIYLSRFVYLPLNKINVCKDYRPKDEE